MSAFMKHLRLVWNTVEFCCHLGNSSHKPGTICSPGIEMWWPSKQGAGKARNRGEPFSRCLSSTEGSHRRGSLDVASRSSRTIWTRWSFQWAGEIGEEVGRSEKQWGKHIQRDRDRVTEIDKEIERERERGIKRERRDRECVSEASSEQKPGKKGLVPGWILQSSVSPFTLKYDPGAAELALMQNKINTFFNKVSWTSLRIWPVCHDSSLIVETNAVHLLKKLISLLELKNYCLRMIASSRWPEPCRAGISGMFWFAFHN